ncbi:putative MFS transporter [Pullulanibacillus pueri]|uniref:MFS transporter n=1 Tax=Pullulanibacillus pueri TaxID=1437324 RepID=A0A8J2ZTF3_9BACL|nr:MFS transporter [Pullulanibacillus pueri]MBM7681338.1 putative MFS transporter [Pullulanibacillus pueri]GGH77535.1 MFS transporter [Pullulanibacillus pueri]
MNRNIPARLERLPVTRFTWKIVLLAGLAWFIESLSIGSLGVVLDPLKQSMHLTANQVGLLTASSTLGIVIGLIPAGFLSDRWGRKRILILGIIEYSLFTLFCAFSPNYGFLLCFRFLSGFGMGAVFPLPYAIVSEFVKQKQRALFNGIMDACLSVGYFIAPLLGLLILPHIESSMSWRLFFIVSSLPILYAYLIHIALPESPRWLVKKGRFLEAEKIMQTIEKQVVDLTGNPLPEPEIIYERPTEQRVKVTPLAPWKHPYFKRTVSRSLAATGAFFMFYIVNTYMPVLFSSNGFSFADSLLFTAVITAAAIPGKLLNGYLSEFLGRKMMYFIFMGMAGVASLFFGLATTAVSMLLFACFMSFFGTGTFPALKMSYAEQYPTLLRTTGTATVEAIGRFFGGVVGSYAMPLILNLKNGMTIGFYMVAAVAFVAIFVELLFSPETKEATLEQLESAAVNK